MGTVDRLVPVRAVRMRVAVGAGQSPRVEDGDPRTPQMRCSVIDELRLDSSIAEAYTGYT